MNREEFFKELKVSTDMDRNGNVDFRTLRDVVTLIHARYPEFTTASFLVQLNADTVKDLRAGLRRAAEKLDLQELQLGATSLWIRFSEKYPGIPETLVAMDSGTMGAKVLAPRTDQPKIEEALCAEITSNVKHVRVAKGFDARRGLLVPDRKITADNLARSCFYPFLEMPMEEYFKKFMESNASVLILIGPPGTGKSTFLRTLIWQQDAKALLAYRPEVLSSPELIEAYTAHHRNLLAIEDSDVFVQSRDLGNQVMASLLNETEGVVDSDKVKLVVSTNLSSIDKIDPALTRPGRCFAIVRFRELTTPEAIVVAKEMGLDTVYEGESTYTLSQVLNPVLIDDDTKRKPRGIGFSNH